MSMPNLKSLQARYPTLSDPKPRRAAPAFLAAEKNFRRVQGYRDPWMLKAALEHRMEDAKEKAA